MPRMYFAHPMVDYDTPIEARALGSLLRHFPDYLIVNPNRREYQDGFAKQGFAFEYWTDLAASCAAIAFFFFFAASWRMDTERCQRRGKDALLSRREQARLLRDRPGDRRMQIR